MYVVEEYFCINMENVVYKRFFCFFMYQLGKKLFKEKLELEIKKRYGNLRIFFKEINIIILNNWQWDDYVISNCGVMDIFNISMIIMMMIMIRW